MKQHTQNTISHTINRHCGLDPQSPTRKDPSSRLGDGVPLSRNDGSSAITVKALAMILLAILMVSCEKEIEFNGEHSNPKLVINSLVEPGQPVSAAISKSFFFLDNEANTIAPDDLVATLYVNGNRIGEMTPHFDTIISYDIWNPNDPNLGHVRKVYTHDYCPVEGDVVKITASANGFEDVEGETSALPKAVDCQMEVEVVNCSGWYMQYYDEETDEFVVDSSKWDVSGNLNLTFTITDPNPGKIDYFRFVVDRRVSTQDGDNWYDINFDYDDPIFGVNVAENEFIDASDFDTRPEGVFTDMLFDGSSYRLKVKVHFECEVDEDFDPDFFRACFMLEHLSREYNNYLYTSSQDDEINQFFAEPVQTYSNVTNGYGIVAGRTVDTLWVNLPLSE